MDKRLNQPELNTPARLREPIFTLARATWLLIAALIIGILVTAMPFAYERFQTPCLDATCLTHYVQLSPQGLAQLRPHGISASFFATWNIALDVVCTSISCVMASVI